MGARLAGGSYSAADETGDAYKFTQALADRCAQRGVRFDNGARIERIVADGDRVSGHRGRRTRAGARRRLRALARKLQPEARTARSGSRSRSIRRRDTR
jgi:glycine/D-amino acid oxidase-like deaminating enzyme